MILAYAFSRVKYIRFMKNLSKYSKRLTNMCINFKLNNGLI